MRKCLPFYFGDKGANLLAEGNYYYEVKKKKKEDWIEGRCGIGQHGDAERSIVIAARLGATFPLEYNWFLKSKPIGKRMHVDLHHGDLYAMSSKAVGRDWKKKLIPTLRHAAGAKKYLNAKETPTEIIYL